MNDLICVLDTWRYRNQICFLSAYRDDPLMTSSPDVTTMSIDSMKEELVSLGDSVDGCVERTDTESRLLEV